MFLIYMVSCRQRSVEINMNCLDTMARYLLYAFLIDFSLEMLALTQLVRLTAAARKGVYVLLGSLTLIERTDDRTTRDSSSRVALLKVRLLELFTY